MRATNRIVLIASGACVAAGVALAWIYYSDKESGPTSHEWEETRSLDVVTPDRSPHPSVDVPESSGGGIDSLDGAETIERRLPSPFEVPAPSESSQPVVEHDEQDEYVQEELPVEPESKRLPDPAAASKKFDMPRGDLAISGRVLTRSGDPISGIDLIATAAQVLDKEKSKLVPVRGSQRGTTSAYNGAYEFPELAAGEYVIRTVSTGKYGRAQISVRAGVDFADLILDPKWEVRVHGVVSTATGEPLAGVRLQPTIRQSIIHKGQTVTTDKDGRYSIEEEMMDNAQTLFIDASKPGYKDEKVSIDTDEINAERDVEINIVMVPDPNAQIAAVSGTVLGPVGETITGQRIDMSSTKTGQRHTATTDMDGKFVIQEVEISDDYMLSINAPDAYEDLFLKNLNVTKEGLTLSIELAVREVGTLTGHMVDVYGNPIANFNLVLQTEKKSFYHERVVGDSVGAFTVENAPAGKLRFRTKSNPYHRVDGIQLEVGTERTIQVILDSGQDEIRGRVLDDRGRPVAVPHINLTWSLEKNGVRSTSRRTTAADSQGDFRFTQLGPGSHTISVSAAGFKPVQLEHDVAEQGFDVTLQLEAQ